MDTGTITPGLGTTPGPDGCQVEAAKYFCRLISTGRVNLQNGHWSYGVMRGWLLNLNRRDSFELLELLDSSSSLCAFVVLIVGPKLFIEPGTKAFFRLSSVSGPGL